MSDLTFNYLLELQLRSRNVHYKGDELIHLPKGEPCVMCGQRAHWVSLMFEASVCTPDCLDKLLAAYTEANKPKGVITISRPMQRLIAAAAGYIIVDLIVNRFLPRVKS